MTKQERNSAVQDAPNEPEQKETIDTTPGDADDDAELADGWTDED